MAKFPADMAEMLGNQSNTSGSHGYWNHSGGYSFGNSSPPFVPPPPDLTTIEHVVQPIICVFGILGIILTVVVLSRKVMCTSTNCYLMALAIADLIFLLLFSSIMIDRHLEVDSKHQMHFQIYGTYAAILMNIFLLASVWITVALALERYIAICRPFLAAKVCTVNKARVFIVIIFVFALACRVINFWENKVQWTWDKKSKRTMAWISSTDLSFDHHYLSVYPWVVDVTITSVIPFLLLLGLNLRLILEVRKSTRYVQRNMMAASRSSTQREEIRITIMLISVVIVFFACQAPYVIYMAIMATIKNRHHVAFGAFFKVFRVIAILLLTLKSAVNFLLYCWFSEKFLATFKRTFCIQKCHEFCIRRHSGPVYDLRRLSTIKTMESTL